MTHAVTEQDIRRAFSQIMLCGEASPNPRRPDQPVYRLGDFATAQMAGRANGNTDLIVCGKLQGLPGAVLGDESHQSVCMTITPAHEVSVRQCGGTRAGLSELFRQIAAVTENGSRMVPSAAKAGHGAQAAPSSPAWLTLLQIPFEFQRQVMTSFFLLMDRALSSGPSMPSPRL